MRESDKLRDRAARLLALAVKAREDDKFLLADEITMLATEASNQADEMDRTGGVTARGRVPAPPARAMPSAPPQQQQQQQQQQQEQPTSGGEKK
jgi:hypothetical protein